MSTEQWYYLLIDYVLPHVSGYATIMRCACVNKTWRRAVLHMYDMRRASVRVVYLYPQHLLDNDNDNDDDDEEITVFGRAMCGNVLVSRTCGPLARRPSVKFAFSAGFEPQQQVDRPFAASDGIVLPVCTASGNAPFGPAGTIVWRSADLVQYSRPKFDDIDRFESDDPVWRVWYTFDDDDDDMNNAFSPVSADFRADVVRDMLRPSRGTCRGDDWPLPVPRTADYLPQHEDAAESYNVRVTLPSCANTMTNWFGAYVTGWLALAFDVQETVGVHIASHSDLTGTVTNVTRTARIVGIAADFCP